MAAEVGVVEQSKEVSGVFQVVGEVWDEALMTSVGSTALANADVNTAAVDKV